MSFTWLLMLPAGVRQLLSLVPLLLVADFAYRQQPTYYSGKSLLSASSQEQLGMTTLSPNGSNDVVVNPVRMLFGQAVDAQRDSTGAVIGYSWSLSEGGGR